MRNLERWMIHKIILKERKINNMYINPVDHPVWFNWFTDPTDNWNKERLNRLNQTNSMIGSRSILSGHENNEKTPKPNSFQKLKNRNSILVRFGLVLGSNPTMHTPENSRWYRCKTEKSKIFQEKEPLTILDCWSFCLASKYSGFTWILRAGCWDCGSGSKEDDLFAADWKPSSFSISCSDWGGNTPFQVPKRWRIPERTTESTCLYALQKT